MTGRLILAALAVLAAGCGSSPPAHFYTLSATATPEVAQSGLAVSVGPVTVPAVVDRPEIVLTDGPNQVQLDEFNRWAAPLQDNLARVVAENLAALLGTPRVTLFPQASGADADYQVAIEVRRFESTLGRSTALDALWTVRRAGDGKSQSGRTEAREAVPDGSYAALAAAHSLAAAQLARDIAVAVQSLERGAQ